MRQCDVLKWVSQDSELWYSEALGIYQVFSKHRLLPESLEAELDQVKDSEAWALFCFCYWTRSEERTSEYYDACLMGDGIEIWERQIWNDAKMVDELQENSDFVFWLQETLHDWKTAIAVCEMSFWLHHEKIIVWMNNDQQFRFVSGASQSKQPLEGLTRHVSNLLIQSQGAAVLWHLSSAFSGQMTVDVEYNYRQRNELRQITRRGNFAL